MGEKVGIGVGVSVGSGEGVGVGDEVKLGEGVGVGVRVGLSIKLPRTLIGSLFVNNKKPKSAPINTEAINIIKIFILKLGYFSR